MTNQTYTPDMVTDEMCLAYRDAQFRVSGIAAAINASPLWAEVQQLREAKRELAEALLPLASCAMPDNPQGNAGFYAVRYQHILIAREALAKHRGI